MADDAGALLVRSGLVQSSALDDARARVASAGGTVGEQLVAAGLLGDDILTDFYKSRLLVPQVNPNTLARLPAKIVALIPSDMAIELRAIPVSLDANNNLTIAMSDPSDRHAVDEIAFFTGAYVVRAVATQMQIAWCLAHYYGHVTSLGQRLLQPNAKEPSAAVIAAIRPVRKRGLTGKVQALRKNVLVPGEVVDEPTAPAPAPKTDDAVPVPRAKSISGEIAVPRVRAQSIKPMTPDFEDESGPVLSLEIQEQSEPVKVVESEPSAPVKVIEIEPSEPVRVIEVAEPSAPVRVIEMEASEPIEPPKPEPPKRKRPAEPDPPELAARHGEVQVATKDGPIRVQLAEEPRIVVDVEFENAAIAESRAPTQPLSRSASVSGELDIPDDGRERPVPQISVEEDTGGVIIREHLEEKSEPVLLHRKREQSDSPTDVIVLETKKPAVQRPERNTQVGIGAITAATRAKSEPSDLVDTDPTRLDARAAPPGDYTTSEEILAAPPSPMQEDNTSPIAVPPMPRTSTPRSVVPPPSGKVKLDNVRPRTARPDDDDDYGPPARATEVMSAVDIDRAINQKNEPIDDGWGNPGDTIPPQFLGAIPGSDEPKSGVIPIPNIDTAPLIVAPPRAPETSRPEMSPQNLSRALEETAGRVLDLIRSLDTAKERDHVITVMVAHLAQTHRRAGFFALRGGDLSLFALSPPPDAMPSAAMRLDRPSTLQDVAGTRLPYRGPMHDETSRAFLAAVLGAAPPEILLVPVTVRERVVGILFGEGRVRHTFDDQLALAARAAGIALERILKAKRS